MLQLERRRQLQSSAKDRNGGEGEGKGSSNCAWKYKTTEALQNKIKSFLTQPACPLPTQAEPNRESCHAMCSTLYMEGVENPPFQGKRNLGIQTYIP